MSTVLEKRKAIEYIGSQIHTGAPTASDAEEAIKTLSTGKVVSAVPATTYAYTHTDQDETLRLSGLTGATAITLAAGDDLAVGAQLIIEVDQDGTGRNVTVDAGTPTYSLTGVANDTDCLLLKYVATGEWILVSNYKSIDAA